jgi:transcriptional regulator with XRE-family HTH domain
MSVMEKVIVLLNERHIEQKELCQYIGISQQQFTEWKAGRLKSYTKHLDKIASFFNVSVDYLLGNSETKEKPAQLKDELKGVNFALYGEVHDLTEKEMQDVLDYVKYMKSKRGK